MVKLPILYLQMTFHFSDLYREGNEVTDRRSKMGFEFVSLNWWWQNPDGIKNKLASNASPLCTYLFC